MPEVTPKRLRELERIHLLRMLALYGPMFASDLADRANEECDHDAFDDLPTISKRGIGQKLAALWGAGLVSRELVPVAGLYRWSITGRGREVAAVDPLSSVVQVADRTAEANAGRDLADALDRFYSDLRYTAPEMVGMRLNQLGARIAEPMAVFGYPRVEGGADA